MSSEEPEAETDDPDADDAEDIRYFVRIGQTDLDGTKSVERALTELNGIGRRTARVVADHADVDRTATFGGLEDDEIDAVVDAVEGLADDAPDWLANRRNDFFTGETTHETGNDLSLTRQQDINRMKMIRSYRGIRHERGQKVRGQRTKSTGRTEGTIGVNVEAIREEQEEEEAGEATEGGEL
ncbi:MAG: 30S ribosomal protein S13 [Halobacteriaceae archaeon]